jgi:putative ABC transport system substrate-binding protein
MRRRDLIKAIASTAVAWPLAARAQQDERMRRMGVLMWTAESDDEGQSEFAAFREELGKVGWTEGRNIKFDARWAAADIESMKRFAKELVERQPDLILTSSTPAAGAMLQQTRTIPIIFVLVLATTACGF